MNLEEDYICDQCGLTTPVPNDHCPSCGAPMASPTGKKEPRSNEETEESDLEVEDSSGDSQGTGEESLEALREEEDREGDEPYDDGDQLESY